MKPLHLPSGPSRYQTKSLPKAPGGPSFISINQPFYHSARTILLEPVINMPSPPETYYVTSPTPHVPNSPLPVLIYRSALPEDPDAETTRSHIESNDWLQGGVFKTYTAHHFHSVTHECYAVFRGSSKLFIG